MKYQRTFKSHWFGMCSEVSRKTPNYHALTDI